MDNTDTDFEYYDAYDINIICGDHGLEVPTKNEFEELKHNASPLKNIVNKIYNSIICPKANIDNTTKENINNAVKSLKTNEYFTLDRFNSIRGAENVHIYFWIGLDLGWMIGNKIMCIFFGTLSLSWVIFMANNYGKQNNTLEIFICLINFIWIYANVIWMIGDIIYNDEEKYSFAAGLLMTIALFLWIVQRFWLRSLGLLKEDRYSIITYIKSGLIPKLKIFGRTWKQCEHCFIFTWLLLDIAWAFHSKWLWICGTISSILMISYLTVSCFMTPYMIIDSVHYFIQLLWLISNVGWSYDDVWNNNSRNVAQSLSSNPKQMRIISAWELITVYIIVIGMYVIWILLNYYDKLPINIPVQLRSSVDKYSDKNKMVVHPVTHVGGLQIYQGSTYNNPMHNDLHTIDIK